MSDWRDLQLDGLLTVGENCSISEHAIFDSRDLLGDDRPIRLADRVRVGHCAVIYGGTTIGEGSVVEDHAVVGKPEYGYAIGRIYAGQGRDTDLADGVIIRSAAVVYAGVCIGGATTIGHHTLVRSEVLIGEDSQLAHRMSIERGCRIGDLVRCSPGSHITSGVVMEDRVFVGAGVVTINDKSMIWRDREREPVLIPPYFEHGAKIGSGSTVAAGVRVGREALVGSGSLVLKDVPPHAVAYGVPAAIRGEDEQ